MKLDEVTPAHCHARAQRLLGEVALIRAEMGRSSDERPLPEISGAAPREVYFEALALWAKADRLSDEVGAECAVPPPSAPALTEVRPGHVLRVLDAALAHLGDVKSRLGVGEAAPEPAIDPARQPSDVLTSLIRANRELSRLLERPFAPEDVFRQVALAGRYAVALAGAAVEAAPLERGRRPSDTYQHLLECLDEVGKRIKAAGHTALDARGTVPEIVPGDVYDLASVVLGEVAFLHGVSSGAPVHAFDPLPAGHRLPAHVDQAARTLAAQLRALA